MFFASSEAKAMQIRHRLDKLLDQPSLLRQPTKGFWDPTQFSQHPAINIDSAIGDLFAPADKLRNTQERHFIGRVTRNSRWLPVRDLQSLA
jgi:hypothetical protein